MQINKKANSNIDLKVYNDKIDPGAVDFTTSFSREKQHMMGKQITVGQLIKLQIIMTISRQ